MLPWKTIITLQKDSEVPVYMQVVNSIIHQVKMGILKPSSKMPGTRAMAEALELNRLTIVKAYDELFAQGWFESIQSKGTFVSDKLPEVRPRKLPKDQNSITRSNQTGFGFRVDKLIHDPAKPDRTINGFHDGPDVRLVPVDLLSRGFRSVLSRKSGLHLLSYTEPEGRQPVRKAIADYLNSTRGLQLTEENLMITRGTQMAMYLLAKVMLDKGDKVIMADIGYRYAELTFMNAGAKICKVPVDDSGIDVDEVEKTCRRNKIKALYLTSHHHYPTTVTLSAARRMKLLHLAEEYRFAIIEDDYDYEFHYETSPILPVASADSSGLVIYIGSFSKTISPAIRIGFIAAPTDLLKEAIKLRMLIDTQGDPLLEQVVAELLSDGEIKRHMKKSQKIYHERRDCMTRLLKEKLSDVISFKIPDGGLSIWAQYDKRIQVPELSDILRKKEVVLSKGTIHDLSAGRKLNCTRMGFAWMNIKEMEYAVSELKDTIQKM